MVNRVPLIANTISSRIAELGVGDGLDLTGSDISNVANVNINGNLNASSFSNFGSVSNVKITGGSSGQVLITDGAGNLSFGGVANYANFAGTVVNSTQSNITSLGTLTSLSVTGNITSGNANLGNLITANYLTSVLTTNAQPNITSVGTLTSLSVTGNITSGNANLGNLVTANFFSGNGSGLTGVYASLPITNGFSNINIIGSGNINFSVSGTANVMTITGIGSNITGNLSVTGTSNVANTLFKKFNETYIYVGTASGGLTPDASAGTIYQYLINNNITINSLSNAVAGTSMTIIIVQGGSGGYSLSSTMKFQGGNKTLSTAVGAIDIIYVFYDGSTYYATLTKGYA